MHVIEGRKVDIAMDALRCPEGDAGVINEWAAEKAGSACSTLLSKPDMLLLDRTEQTI